MLDIYYINLDSAVERRSAIERNLKKFEADGVKVTRVPAYDKKYVEDNNIIGTLRSSEKGCFLSHMKAIETSLEKPGYALILEDDISLGSKSISHIKDLLTLVKNDIDLLFAEICISNIPSMFQLFQLKKEFMKEGKIEILQTKLFDFAGATAYILNNESKLKLLKSLQSLKSFDIPFDLQLKNLIMDGRISSGFIFPFVATLSGESLNTDIQLDVNSLPNIVYHSFRKLMYLEANQNPNNYLNDLQRVPDGFYEADDLAFGKIISTAVSSNFPLRLF